MWREPATEEEARERMAPLLNEMTAIDAKLGTKFAVGRAVSSAEFFRLQEHHDKERTRLKQAKADVLAEYVRLKNWLRARGARASASLGGKLEIGPNSDDFDLLRAAYHVLKGFVSDVGDAEPEEQAVLDILQRRLQGGRGAR